MVTNMVTRQAGNDVRQRPIGLSRRRRPMSPRRYFYHARRQVTRTTANSQEIAPPVSAWRSAWQSGGTRLLLLPASAILGIVNSRLIIDHFGEGAFAQYGLLVGLGSLLPFADLGMAAAIVNVVGQSDDPATDPAVRRVLTTALRVLFGSFIVLSVVCAVITMSGSWPRLLGGALLPGSGATAAAICGALIAITMLVAFGQRILVGLHKNHVTIALSGLQTPVVLLTVAVIIALKARLGSYVAVSAYASTFVISLLACAVASRSIRPAVGEAIRGAWHVRTVRGGRVFDVAWPMLIQMIALPLAMQTDRLVLSHVSTLANVARYNLASQIFTPVWLVVSAAGAALWPIFAKARVRPGSPSASPTSLSLGFGGAAAVACIGLGIASPWLVSISSGGQIRIGAALIITFGVFMVMQGLKYPVGMYMTDAQGLRFQAYMILLLLPLNLGLSIWLARLWGAVGPVLGSTVSVFFCQVLANWLWVRRHTQRVAAASE
jgi:O-antigen/teichoic acid export membrane protein